MAELDLRKVKWQDDLAAELGFKRTPVLTFKTDNSIERGDRVFALLNKAENGEEHNENIYKGTILANKKRSYPLS